MPAAPERISSGHCASQLTLDQRETAKSVPLASHERCREATSNRFARLRFAQGHCDGGPHLVLCIGPVVRFHGPAQLKVQPYYFLLAINGSHSLVEAPIRRRAASQRATCPKRPRLKSSIAWRISPALFMTKGPWPTTGSLIGSPVSTSRMLSLSV